MKKLLLIDETGQFTPNKLNDSYVFGVIINNFESYQINRIISQYLNNNNLAIDKLHNHEMKDDDMLNFKNYIFEKIPQNNFSIIKNNTDYDMRYSDDHNYMIALENVLNYFITKCIEENDDSIDIIIAKRNFGVINPHKNGNSLKTNNIERSNEDMTTNNIKRSNEAMTATNIPKWEGIYKKYFKNSKKIKIYWKDFHREGYYCLTIPDIFCALEKRKKLIEIPIYTVSMKLVKFYENITIYDKTTSIFLELKHLANKDDIKENEITNILNDFNNYDRNKILKNILNEINFLGKYENIHTNIKKLKNFQTIIARINTSAEDNNLLSLYTDFLINRKIPLPLQDGAESNFNNLLNSTKLFNNSIDKLRFEIDFYLIYYIRKYFFNLYFPNDWDSHIKDLITKIELIIGEENQNFKDYDLARLYGTLAQGYSLSNNPEKAEENFPKNKNHLPENNNKCDNYLYTFYWYYYNKYEQKYKEIEKNYFSSNRNNDFYFILNKLRSVIINENNIEDDLDNILKIIEDKKEEDFILYFLIKKWIAINYYKINIKEKTINILETLLKDDTLNNNNTYFIYKLLRLNIDILIKKLDYDNSLNLDYFSDEEKERVKNIKLIKGLIDRKYLIQNLNIEDICKILPFYFS